MRFLNLLGNKFFSLAFSWLLGQPIKDTLCGTKVLWRGDYERIAANRAYFGDFDPFGDFDLLFGAAKLNLKIVDLPIRYRERTYGTTNIQRWRHGWLLLRMVRSRRAGSSSDEEHGTGVGPDRSRSTLRLLPYRQYVGVNRDDPLRFYYWPVLGAVYRGRVERCLDECRGGARVLEVGFGSGVTFLNLHAMYGEIHRLDLTADAGEVARAFQASGVPTHLRNGRVQEMPYADGFFDTVLLISILEHLRPDEQDAAFREIRLSSDREDRSCTACRSSVVSWSSCFALMGYNIREHHFSTERRVAEAAERALRRVRLHQMTTWLGPVYEIGRFVKP